MRSKPSSAERFERGYVRPAAGRTLVVGSYVAPGKLDRRTRYVEALGVDMRQGPGVDRVVDLEEPTALALGTFAHIECLSVLEHSRRPWLLAENLQRLLQPSGTLFVSAPFVWRFHGYPNDYFRFTAEGVRALFPSISWTAVMYVSDKLRPDHFLKAGGAEGHPMLPRCEIMAFGSRA
jgi:SAM-dependent methyltransferase